MQNKRTKIPEPSIVMLSWKMATLRASAILALTLIVLFQLTQEPLVEASNNDLRRHTKRHNEPLDDSAPHYQPLTFEPEEVSSSEMEASSAAARQQQGKRTLYACEEKQLQIECQLGESIQLIRANYGRFSIQICNDHGQLEWQVNCQSPASRQIIANSCQAKQSCQLLASNSIFGDACPGTQKYLEVHYRCAPANRTSEWPAGANNQATAAPVRPQNGRHVIHPAQPPSEKAPPARRPPAPAMPAWTLDLPVGAPANATRPTRCPEAAWRQVHWPESEPGQLVQAACPPHARSGNPSDPYAASLACLPGGLWAPRVQAARCQSLWLRNLTQRLEAGDSPLSLLAELAARTRPPATPLLALLPAAPAWPAAAAGPSAQPPGLFGDDLAQIARLVRRLVDEMGELMNRIGDDKQRLVFAREMLQSLIELINNLAHEHQLDAWLDLVVFAGERQRVAGQLLQALEGAGVLLAGAQAARSAPEPQQQQQQADYVRATDAVYLAIRSVSLQPDGKQNRSFEARFPNEASVLGTKWMDADQSFTLHLQANTEQAPTMAPLDEQPLSLPAQPESLKIVFVLIRALGAHMEPGTSTPGARMVNSDLVSVSIVADSRYKYAPIKVDLSAPLELVFRHSVPLADSATPSSGPRCVYWDNNVSDWFSDGCKLVASNRTHSSCACNHLTTFGLLTEWPEHSASTQSPSGFHAGQDRHHEPASEPPRVQLDSVENELILPGKLLYLAKLLDGRLFGPQDLQPGARDGLRLLVYLSSLSAGALLAAYLVAAAYSHLQARRLLGAMPAHPPPPLLVTQHHSLRAQPLAGSNADTTPSSLPSFSSDYSAALSANKAQLQEELAGGRPRPLPELCRHRLQVPIHLVVQLLGLELLLVLLVESQNYFEPKPQPLGPSVYPIQGGEPARPIGLITWTIVMLLYYLVFSVTCWFGGQLIQLGLCLLELQSSSSGSTGASTLANDKSAQHFGSSSANPVASSIYGRPSTLYGPSSGCYTPFTQGRAQAGLGVHSSTSPTSSFSSAEHSAEHQAALGRLEDSARLYGHTAGVAARSPLSPINRVLRLSSSGQSRPVTVAVVHLLPAALTGLLGWLSSEPSQWLNGAAYTSSLAAQLAYWPLLVESGWSSLRTLLWLLPSICLGIAGWSLFLVRQRPADRLAIVECAAGNGSKGAASVVNPYGSSSAVNRSSLVAANEHQMALNKQSIMQDNSRPSHLGPANRRRAKHLCWLLVALMALHSAAWSAFFLHVHLALAGKPAGGQLLATLAGANLLLVGLLVWSQRRTLRRAAQSSGLSRALACGPSAHKRARLYGAAAPAQPKVSPSSQSLFLVSQAAHQQQPYATTPSYHYGPSYSSGSSQAQQQLYQQQQHIYDSAGTLSEQRHRVNVIQMIQHQQQHRGQQFHPMHQITDNQFQTLNRSLGSLQQRDNQLKQSSVGQHQDQLLPLDVNQALKQQQQFLCNQTQRLDQTAKTLHRIQQSGEADGPLVAFSSNPTTGNHLESRLQPTTFGPTTSLVPASHHQQQHLHHHQQQQLIARQLFNQQPDHSSQSSGQHCITTNHTRHSLRCSASAGHSNNEPDNANQHQYYSINNSQRTANTTGNYTEALKAAMIEQQNESSRSQSELVLHHFRQANSKQQHHQQRLHRASVIDGSGDCCAGENLYDVANYALQS